MPDPELEAYFANKRATSGNEEGKGIWGAIADRYDKWDQDWLPDRFSGKNTDPEGYAKYAEDNWGTFGQGLSNVYKGANAVSGGIANALVGSPIRTASTAATIATAPVGVAAKLGSALKPVGYAARTLDAANSLRDVARAKEDIGEGRYLRAAGDVAGAGLSAVGATTPIGKQVPRTTSAYPAQVVNKAKVANVTNEALPAAKQFDMNVSSTLPDVQAPAMVQGTLPISSAPPPARFSRTVMQPQVAGELTEGSGNMMLKGKRLGPKAEDLAVRARAELDALKLPTNEKIINKYLIDSKFRQKIQRQAEIKGASQRYESTSGSKFTLEAPTPEMRPKNVTITDVRMELSKRGVADPSDQLVARVRRDPTLLQSMGLNSDEMVGSVMPPNQVKGLLEADNTRVQGLETSKYGEPTNAGRPLATAEDIQRQGQLFAGDELPEAKLAAMESRSELDPSIREAAGQARKKYAESNLMSQLGKSVGISSEEELARMGDVGNQISRMEKIRSTDTPILYNQYASQAQKALEGIEERDISKVVDYIEGNLSNPTKEIERAGDALKAMFKQTGKELEDTGLLEKGARGEEYFPHRWEEGFFAKGNLEANLRKAGKSESEIERITKHVRERGERKITAQYSRDEYEIPGYRKDKDTIFEHLSDLAQRVTTAKLYGAKDIDDPTSPLSMLVNKSEDPDRARDIMKRLLDRDSSADGAELGKKISRVSQNYATANFLSQFLVSNLGGSLPLAMRSSFGQTLSGIKQAFQNSAPEMKFMDNVNNYQKITGAIGQTYADSSLVNRLFGIEKAQNFMNRAAAGAGKGYVQILFDQAKADSKNKTVMGQLEDLILENPVDVLKQKTLNPKQIERAMVRMAEITQGVNEGRKLPHEWNRTGITRVPQIFMRYNFQTTKAIKDAIVQDPIKNVPKLLAAGTILGEFIGDTKEAINTTAEVAANNMFGSGEKELGSTYAKNIDLRGTGGKGGRMDFARQELAGLDKLTKLNLAENPLAVRAFANLQQAFALGIPFDILANLAEEKPNPADMMVIPSEITRGLGGAGEAVREGSLQNVGREAIKRIPFVGRGMSREFPTIDQSKREAKKSGRVKRMKW